MPQLTPELAQAIHNRIRYYRDLGIHDLYRRCEPSAPSVIDEIETVAVTIPEPEPTIPPRKAATPPSPSPVITTTTESVISSDRSAALKIIQDELVGCTRCPLAFQGRHTIVFGDGNPDARVMFIGEGPGADE